jgi:hypothetical protein
VKTANGVFGLGLLALLGYWVLIYPRWLPDAWVPYVAGFTLVWLLVSIMANIKNLGEIGGSVIVAWVGLFIGAVIYLRSCAGA